MTKTVRIDNDVAMMTRDGTILRADIYRPGDRKKHPAILLRTPYNKIKSVDTAFMNIYDAVMAGYAVVIQDIRGRFASEGKYNGIDIFLTVEGPDGYDTVEWIAGQSWCDGNIGTAGGSYLGRLQWMTAKENPPHLKAMAPWVTSSTSTNEASLMYGVIPLVVSASSAITMGLGTAEKLHLEGQDVAQLRNMLNRAISHPEEVYNFLPLKDIPHFNFPEVKEIWQARSLKAIPDMEDEKRTSWEYEKVTVPCYYSTGWYEFYSRGAFYNLNCMMNRGGSETARRNQYMIVGPWTHTGGLHSYIGDINFGVMADARGAQLTEHNLAFFNKHLRGMDIEIPFVRYFVMGSNIWREGKSWPLPQTEWQRFFLHSKGKANTRHGNGILNRDQPSSEPPDIYIYNPGSPVPSAGGAWAAGFGYIPGPADQNYVEQRSDVLCYTSPAFNDDVEISGPLELHLFASTSAVDTDFTVKLVDVYSDGHAYNVADGIIRAKYRESVFKPLRINPGEIIEYIIKMGNTSQLFKKGHAIRIDISSSNFPVYDRNMNTGNPIGEDSRGIAALQTIFHESQYVSFIDLPVIK